MQNKNLINESEISEALEAVSRDGTNISKPRFMHLQDNKRVVLAAVRNCGWALKYASEELRNDWEIVLAAVKKDGCALAYASSEALREDPKFVLVAVREFRWALKFASEELREDPKFVLAAVSQNGQVLKYFSEELRGDRKIVLAAMKEDLYACRYSLLGHEETKALLKEISLEKYVSPGELKGISVFDRIRKDDSIIVREQNEQTLSKIISYFSLRDASIFSELTKETNKLMKPDLRKVAKKITFKKYTVSKIETALMRSLV